jgi:DNA anti-recombination protein RmuC
MSQLTALKQQINSIGDDAKRTGQSLAGFKSKFSSAVSQVSATVGGSSRQVDKELIAALQAAEKQVDAAVAALQSAGKTATGYAQSL